jgi:NADH-quinone oxidoreductase subunit H
MDFGFIISSALKIFGFVFLMLMPMIAYIIWVERRFLALIQDRVGPNRVGIPWSNIGFFGLGQPIADGVKSFLKEDFTPAHVRKLYYVLAPALVMVPALLTCAVLPFGRDLVLPFLDEPVRLAIADLDIGPIWIFAIASLGVYGIVLAGWASNSKYPFLGGVRATSQMISYEISLGLSIIPVLLLFQHLNLGDIVRYQSDNGWLLLPMWGEGWSMERWLFLIPGGIAFIIFVVSMFAETNRTPFDLPECETELVAGYHTEYSSMKFAMFFMGEYAAMIIGSGLAVTLFLGGWSMPFGLDGLVDGLFTGTWFSWVPAVISMLVFFAKIVCFMLFFIWVRGTLPRFRYDQLMHLGWIVFFEAALANIVIAAGILMLV